MSVIGALRQSIGQVGIKEVARRAGLSPSTVSRISSGLINPSLDVVERISGALGLSLRLSPDREVAQAPRLAFSKDVLIRLRKELKALGVKHVVIFGSVARLDDKAGSDIDVFLDFGLRKPRVAKLLRAEGRVIESFGAGKVDVVSDLSSARGQRLKAEIDKDGIRVF